MIAQAPFPDFVRRSARTAKAVADGLLVDVFAGFGGGSIASERAHGRPVDLAINHWPVAIEYHTRNHPLPTKHLTADIREVDPVEACGDAPILHAHFSPDCRHYSGAKGGSPVADSVRALPWVVLEWARKKQPMLITMENVREFLTWGPTKPVVKDGAFQRFPNGEMKRLPDPAKKGQTFKLWLGRLKALGYEVSWNILDAADFGAPTHRRRLFLVARRDGKAVAWPKPSHGNMERKNGNPREQVSSAIAGNSRKHNGQRARKSRTEILFPPQRDDVETSEEQSQTVQTWPVGKHDDSARVKPYRTAAECIDFSRPCPSIFMTREDSRAFKKATGIQCIRPLAKKTLWRTAKGIERFVINSKKPFIVRTAHGETSASGAKRWGHGSHAIDEPLPTVAASKDFALISPTISKYYGQGFAQDISEPLHTVTTKDRFGLIAANLVQANHGGTDARVKDVREPLNVITGKHGYGISACQLVKFRGDSIGTPAENPMPTITAGQGATRDAGAAHALGMTSAVLVEVQNASNIGARDVDRPAPTIMANPKGGGWALAQATFVPFVIGCGGRAAQSLPTGGDAPIGTITGKNDRSLAAAFLAKLRGSGGWKPCDMPLDTVCAGAATFAHVSAFLVKMYGTSTAADIMKPLATVTAGAGGGHMGAVHAYLAQGVSEAALAGFWRVYGFLIEHLGPDAPLPMLTVDGHLYLIVDVGLRMLEPRELLNAQFTPEIAKDYLLPSKKSLAVKLIGNSVSPPVLEAVIRAQGIG